MSTEKQLYNTSLTPSMRNQLVSDAKAFFGDDKAEVPEDKHLRNALEPYLLEPERYQNLHNRLKEAGYSVHRDVQQLKDTLKVFASEHVKVDRNCDPNYRRAKERVEQALRFTFPPKVLDYSSNEDVMDAMPRKDTSAGFDYYETGRRHKCDYSDIALEYHKRTLNQALKNGTFNAPIRCFERLRGVVALSITDEVLSVTCKDRLVQCVALKQIISENKFAYNFQTCMQTKDWYATGKIPSELRRIVISMWKKFPNWVSIDYSKYDQTLPGWLIRDVFGIIFRTMGGERWDSKLKREWKIMVHDFIEKSIIGPNGKLILVKDGVPSGSRWTNLVDSLCNILMLYTYQEWCLSHRNGQLTECECCICGDDNLVCYKGSLNLTQMSEYMAAVFGTKMKAEACKQGDKESAPQFLSAEWRLEGNWRDPRDLYIRMLWPERFRDYKSNPMLSPEAIIMAYILAYPKGMEELIDVKRFKMDHAEQYRGAQADEIVKQLPGIIRYERMYLKDSRIA